jgi:hypothetical protein
MPLPEGSVPELTLAQASAFMSRYYKAWNHAARKSQEIRPDELSTADIDRVMQFYADDFQVIQNDNGILNAPPIVFPAIKDFARKNFVEFFLRKQRGSVHKTEYLCVSGNRIVVGMRYYAPFVGKFLNPEHPNPRNVAVTVPLIGSYTIENGVVKVMEITYDFGWFFSESAKNGVPVQP